MNKTLLTVAAFFVILTAGPVLAEEPVIADLQRENLVLKLEILQTRYEKAGCNVLRAEFDRLKAELEAMMEEPAEPTAENQEDEVPATAEDVDNQD